MNNLSRKSSLSFAAMLVFASLLAGASSSAQTLSRDQALTILKKEQVFVGIATLNSWQDPARMHWNVFNNLGIDGQQYRRAIDTLANAGFITSATRSWVYPTGKTAMLTFTDPTSALQSFILEKRTHPEHKMVDYQIELFKVVPSKITGIAKLGENFANVEYTVEIVFSPLAQHFLRDTGVVKNLPLAGPQRRQFQKYDDGWRIANQSVSHNQNASPPSASPPSVSPPSVSLPPVSPPSTQANEKATAAAVTEIERVAAVIAARAKQSQSSGPGNLCGSSVSKFLVPDYFCFDAQGQRVPYAACAATQPSNGLTRHRVSFTAACSRHDECYGRRNAAKANCDAAFYEDLKAACRSQIQGVGVERLSKGCIDTALQYNDVVRGQATRRLPLWMGGAMIQQVPFTGQSACDAYKAAQTAAGVAQPSCTDEAVATPVGQWHDGGPGCASIGTGLSARHLVFRSWYCESGSNNAKPLVVEHDATMDAYVHELTGLSVRLLPNGRLEVTAQGDIRERLGAGTYLAEPSRSFQRK